MNGDRNTDWPGWLEPLRPDALTRTRMKRGILARALPLLEARRPLMWQDIAAAWSRTLVPLAAAMMVVFAGLAYSAARRPATQAVAELPPAILLEGVVEPADRLPDVLTAASEPGADEWLTAVISYQERARR